MFRPLALRRVMTLALHARAALHRMYVKLLNCVTGVKANESGNLASGVTRVTRVTRDLEGGRVSALTLPSQIDLALHSLLPGNRDDRRTTASSVCVAQGTEPCCKSLEHLVPCG